MFPEKVNCDNCKLSKGNKSSRLSTMYSGVTKTWSSFTFQYGPLWHQLLAEVYLWSSPLRHATFPGEFWPMLSPETLSNFRPCHVKIGRPRTPTWTTHWSPLGWDQAMKEATSPCSKNWENWLDTILEFCWRCEREHRPADKWICHFWSAFSFHKVQGSEYHRCMHLCSLLHPLSQKSGVISTFWRLQPKPWEMLASGADKLSELLQERYQRISPALCHFVNWIEPPQWTSFHLKRQFDPFACLISWNSRDVELFLPSFFFEGLWAAGASSVWRGKASGHFWRWSSWILDRYSFPVPFFSWSALDSSSPFPERRWCWLWYELCEAAHFWDDPLHCPVLDIS